MPSAFAAFNAVALPRLVAIWFEARPLLRASRGCRAIVSRENDAACRPPTSPRAVRISSSRESHPRSVCSARKPFQRRGSVHADFVLGRGLFHELENRRDSFQELFMVDGLELRLGIVDDSRCRSFRRPRFARDSSSIARRCIRRRHTMRGRPPGHPARRFCFFDEMLRKPRARIRRHRCRRR